MTTDQNLMLYAKLGGFRLVVLANRFGCDSGFSQDLHDRLIEGLDAAIARIQMMMALERSVLTGEDELAEYQLQGENEIFGRFTINLLDDLEIDFDTHEYRINGGGWINALASDDSGAGVQFPTLVGLTDEEFGSLVSIIMGITLETGIPVDAARVVYGRGAVEDELP
ncbi:hypothetical protein GFL91_13655 [Rhizobium leguminosarum bv. viciae]|uniref:Uncharacterized protein n=1 Tax=Rhizobium leguminosarum bv. viciae TaxID=387 RepID=A0A8I2KGZ0_RHILV|nr:hypothetical protein [Rhizobium leguminosarum]MBY5790661.1 hypothetical protein [Rhizobium leguminosarum]NKM46019.1 hypothetical protein [Rhizobium leguminosarum bv. viciae]